MKLIGLVGRKSVGKDTAALVLTQQGYQIAKFAGALKAMIAGYLDYIGLTEDAIRVIIEDYRVKEVESDYFCGRSPRHAMQTLGTEWGRDLMAQDIWVRACMLRCKSLDKAVITDVRFPNEVAAVKEAGGSVIRIVRNASRVDNHASENFIDSLAVDHEISNNGTITELHQKLLVIVKGQNNGN